MNNSVYQLCYLSKSSDSMESSDIEDILLKARDYNHSEEITGILLYRSGIFIQLLEAVLFWLISIFSFLPQS